MNPSFFTDDLQSMLKESIDQFFAEYGKGVTDFSNFTSIFSRFMQNLRDPPLEIVWFYSGLIFHSTKLAAQDFSQRVMMVKDSFQLLVAGSSSYNAAMKTAVLAPVMYLLGSLLFEGKNNLKTGIESLLEGVVSYVSICSGTSFNEHEEYGGLSSCFVDVVRVWVVDKIDVNCKVGEVLKVFFPIVSDGVRRGMMNEGYQVGYLAGIVLTEAFLLRLCLKFSSEISRAELEKELHDCAVQTMNAFRSYYFIDALLRMLLEPVLPVISMMLAQPSVENVSLEMYEELLSSLVQINLQDINNSEDEVFLRKILYDAVMTMECSFLGPLKGNQLPGGCFKNLAVTWLFVAESAIQFVRNNGDQTKVTSLAQAFSHSHLPSQLIKWITNESDMLKETITPNVSSPTALLQWLLTIEDQGVRVFDSNISRIYAKSISVKSDLKILGGNHFFCSGSEGNGGYKHSDLEMFDYPRLMRLTPNGTRKRKEGQRDDAGKQIKLFKCHINDNSVREKILPLGEGDDDGMSSGSEVDNPVSDEDIELMEQ